jgi:UDPglucose 6-dehydrogenase
MAEKGFDVFVFDKSGKIAKGGKHPDEEEVRHGDDGWGSKWTTTEPIPAQSVSELVHMCEAKKDFSNIYFVCVPTPMYEDGSCDTSIVEAVLRDLAEVIGKRIAVVKSTVPPGSTERWNKMFEGTGLSVVFCPEFLTEANALDDMRNQNRIVLGGPRPHINSVKQIFQTAFPKVPIVKTSSTTAEMVKYFTNVQLASRVVLSCELFQICEALDKKGLNIDYDKVKEYANYDSRLGGSHMNVPGNDGGLGAKGHCFPKDLNALIDVAKSVGVKPTVMSAVWEKNLEVVPEEQRDWEKMQGRAVSKKNK